MSAISTILAKLRSAIWAIDVRDDIADAIEQCYSDVSNPTLQTEALEAAIQEKIDEGEMAALTIGDGTITAAKLAANAVTTPKIADGSITQEKLDPNIDFVQVDDTLSQTGEAADAAAVGAAIDELNGSLGDSLYKKGEDLQGTTTSNYALRGDGRYIADSNSELKKYQVTAGESVYLSLSADNTGTYQWQNQASVPSSVPSAVIIGDPVNGAVDGFYKVPTGATYLIVSQLKANTTNVVKSATNIGDIVDDNSTAISELRESMETISLSAEIKTALIACFNNVAWVGTDGETLKQNLQDALFPPEPETLGYVKNGLIALWDGMLNTPEGHDDSATKWTDLINGHEFTAMQSANKTWSFGTNCMTFAPTASGATVQQSNCIICPNFGKSGTVEICIDWGRNDESTFIGFFTGEETGQDALHLIGYSSGDKSIVTYNNTLDGNYSVSDITSVHGISATYGDNRRNCYIDGVQATQRGKSNAFSGDLPSSIGYKYLVVGGHPGYTFKGKIYSIRIYNRVLTASEVAANHAYDVSRFNLG